MIIFFVLLTLGFIFELGKNALTIDSRQTSNYGKVDSSETHAFLTSSSKILKAGADTQILADIILSISILKLFKGFKIGRFPDLNSVFLFNLTIFFVKEDSREVKFWLFFFLPLFISFSFFISLIGETTTDFGRSLLFSSFNFLLMIVLHGVNPM